LWFLTRDARITRLVADQFADLPEAARPAGQRVLTLAADENGSVWAGTDQGIFRWNGDHFGDMTPTNGESSFEAPFILPVRGGGVWVLSGGRLRKQIGRQWVSEAEEWRGLLGWAAARPMGAHEDRQGGVWFNHYGNGLFHVTPEGRFERFVAREGELPGGRLWAWFQGLEGDVWLGVDRGGLVRLRQRRFHVIDAETGLSARTAMSVCEDPEGAVWLGTAGGGLYRWDGDNSQNFMIGNDPSANFVFSAYPRRGGGLWLSAAAGEDFSVFRKEKIDRAPWEVHGVKAILEDRAGRVWLGTKSGVSWWTAGRRRSFTTRDGMTASAVRALAEDRAGNVWCGAEDGTLYRCVPDRLEAFRPSDALAGQPIWSLLADDEGAVWAGTFRGGLLHFKDGSFSRLTTEHGLPSDVIGQILEDDEGWFWLGTHRGVCRVPKASLTACAAGKSKHLDCATYGRQDGLPTLECSGGYQPACWRGSDGRLWFATVKGMVSVQPEELGKNPVAPQVVIEEMRVDGERTALDGGLVTVPPGRQQFEFGFTAPSFIDSDNVRFRYRLEGLEQEWVEAGTRRTAQYSHLSAGPYKFHVLACNNDGVWNTTGTVLALNIRPHFYETWWFLATAVLVILGSVAASVRAVTTRKYRLALARLEQQHAIESDRARIAKDIHDDLGAGLTQITLLSELARRDPPEQIATHLERISDSARRMTRAMDEIVWAVDPQHDTLTGLMDYISAYTEDFLRLGGIRCRMDLPAELPALHVDAEVRHNLFLALQEALNNVVKHAQATEVWLRFRAETDGFALLVEDNGRGLNGGSSAGNGDRFASGHGLANMKLRLEMAGGSFEIESRAGKGTSLRLKVRATPQASPIMASVQNGQSRAE
jgi:signal transduction histidine kinase/ligand-binding sensor domain-containing protein